MCLAGAALGAVSSAVGGLEPVSQLFRPEVAEAQRQNWLGQVQLVRPMSLTIFSVGVLCLLALVIAFLFLRE